MNYLYHMVPNDMRGEVLYPLNQLKQIYPDIYKTQVTKYVGREQVMDQGIPTLGCLWNDVLHLSAVHPKHAYDSIRKLGRNVPTQQYYEIPATMLEQDKTTIYLYAQKSPEEKFLEQNWMKYDPVNLEPYTHLPERTKQYYKEMIDSGENPFLWVYVPHVLYCGELDTHLLTVIKV